MTEDEVKAIDHEIMMSEELISRDEVITLIALKHLSKEENFHGAITRLNRQVKKLPTVTVKAELVEVLDKISKEIDGLHQKPVGFENEYEGGCNHAVDSVLDIIEKYKGVSE